MTDQGYRVFWNEPEEHTLRVVLRHRDFTTKLGADEFAATLASKEQANPRVYERPHTSDIEFKTKDRDNTDVLNRRRLVELMLLHNITIPARDFDKWRPTVEKTGRIEGVADGLTCIATDGLQGYFLRDDRQPLIGHVGWFKWDEASVTTVTYLDEDGAEQSFQQVVKSGAPPPYYSREKKMAKPRSRKPRMNVPMTAPAALDLIARMTAEMTNGSAA